ncbi:hypothetical protein [uncultured Capnocytophaga sp.]|uniref:hypothetical protein n=1 Tax=uncultured Capnocytophaga sp. TaxID=159273 RepID=UPI002631A6B5|nr:hypothetical protein [uncultured Capnocytophaga sp.]
MKNIFYMLILIVFLYYQKTHAQYFTWTTNPRLLAQVTANNGVRLTSLEVFKKSFEKQKKWYEDAKKDMTKVLAVHEFIYEQLYNVNSLFKQGQKVRYINEYVKKILNELQNLLDNGNKNIKYIHVVIRYYKKVFYRIEDLGKELKTIIEKNKELLMDPYDRDELLDNHLFKLQMIYIELLNINNMLEFSSNRAYIYSIPELGTWIETDKDLTKDIIQKIKTLKYY